jgi:spermidine synthase
MKTTPLTRALQVFLLAMATLILEVSLTRIFSFITYYHFTYLVISVAMLGFGAAGTYLTIRKPEDISSDGEFLASNAWWLSLSTIASVVIISRIHFYPADLYLYRDYSNLFSLIIIVLAAAAPFFFAGICIGSIISNAGSAINSVYFADLAGAATGCLLALALINYLGGIASCFAVAVIAMAVAVLSSRHKRRRYLGGLLICMLSTAVIAYTDFFTLYVPPEKHMFNFQHMIERIKWHVITRLDVSQPIEDKCSFGGGLSLQYKGAPQKVRLIFQDGSNLTGIINPTPTPLETASLGYYMQGAPYQVKPHAEALVIGCGGGADILIALHYNAKFVVGVDVNPHMIELIKETYKDFAGNVFQRSDVELNVSEGRHFLGRDRRTFDVIQLSGVDTWSALSTGAYALTENFIYTSEAFDQYLAHLKEGGIVNFSRPCGDQLTETPKLAATALDALGRIGASNPSQHLVVVKGMGYGSSWPWAQTLVKRSPFTPAEVEKLTQWTQSMGFEMLYDPYTVRKGELETLIRATPGERERFIAQHWLNIRPATDNAPFFFQFHRWRDVLKRNSAGGRLAQFILLASFVQVAFLSGILILYPLYRRKTIASQPGGRTGIFTFFAALGLGFIIVEITLLQKFMVFLGGPAYSMAITLFTLLLLSGIGSFLSRNLSEHPIRLLRVVIPLLAVVICLEAFSLDPIMASLMNLSPLLRCLAVIILIAPLGLLMGMPFPAGLRYVDQFRPELNPWAWGINACATVMGSGFCIFISSALGFRSALIFSAAVYLTGWFVLALSQRNKSLKGL